MLNKKSIKQNWGNNIVVETSTKKKWLKLYLYNIE